MSRQQRAARHWAVIAAAGQGERMSAEQPKQYLSLCGRTLLEHTLRPFVECPALSGIVVVIASGDSRWSDLPVALDPRIRAVSGGAERMHSVLNGLNELAREAQATDWVLVHDAARPCLDRANLERLINSLEDDAVGGLLAVQVRDTLKRADRAGEHVMATVEREGLWAAQTPQMFRYELLHRALDGAVRTGLKVTDEAGAVEALGERPRLVSGSPRNIKVTLPEDLSLAEAILTAAPGRA
ncbi:MAG TPA: 2-C-methyl-D-erythritol 4-phosphate cytidylyltransferase [Steroidobacteraceae bacterium]